LLGVTGILYVEMTSVLSVTGDWRFLCYMRQVSVMLQVFCMV